MNAASQNETPGEARAGARRTGPGHRAWGALTIAIVALYVWPFVGRGWIPHDEGTIAGSAERILQGEVPHRDFDEGYTGGLSYLHAAAFRLAGMRLLSLRLVLYGFFLLFAAGVFGIARRFGPPWEASLLTLLATAWSLPNYFASLPSWYNLFFAVFAALALTRSVEAPGPWWTLAAGLCAGTSVLFKQVGLYAVAAGLLFLVYREQTSAECARSTRGRPRAFLIVKTAGAVAFVVLLGAVFGGRRQPADLLFFVFPGVLVVGFLVWEDWRRGGGDSGRRFARLVRTAAPFLAGVLAPVAVFAGAFALAGSIRPLLQDMFVNSLDPGKTASAELPGIGALWTGIPYALLLAFPIPMPARTERRAAAALGAILVLVLFLAFQPETYRAVWNSSRTLPVAVAIAGVALLARSGGTGAVEAKARQRVFLLLCMAALVGLVQYPFSSPVYFCYVAPLAGLAAAALVAADPRAPRRVHLVVLAFYLAFAVAWMNRGSVFRLGRYFAPSAATTPLALPRGGLRVPATDTRTYDALIRGIELHARGEFIYAGPDCPEVYFLAARRNPTRSFFEYQGELYGQPAALLRRIEDRGVTVVVVNRTPAFSKPFGPDFLRALGERFPSSVEIGNFTLFWRDGRPPPPRL